jgi:5'-nucleotidase
MRHIARTLSLALSLPLLALGPGSCDPGELRDLLRELHDRGDEQGGGGGHGCAGHEGPDGEDVRREAGRRVSWKHPHADRCKDPVDVQILGFNDFHGQLSAGRFVAGRPVGSAAVLASYLKHAQKGREDSTFISHAGDHVGATPPSSALLQDEPSITFLNLLGSKHCKRHNRAHPQCNLVGTLGNHEFDEGKDELLRLIDGGNHASGPFLEKPYGGTTFPYVSANVVDAKTGESLLPPYVIKRVGDVAIGFIGAVLKETPTIVTPTGVAGLAFLDEAAAINEAVSELRRRHVRAIVVLIHQGGRQTSYSGATKPEAAAVDGAAIVDIVSRLDDEVDVVVAGHAHSFTNALLKTAGGKEVLVTQAFSSGTAYGDIDLQIDPATGDVIAKSAAIVTTWADEGPGLTPDAAVAKLTADAEAAVAPLVNQVIGAAATAITRAENQAGESALGNLIADAQRAAMGTDFAFMNPGGIRADLAAGPVTWGALFTVQPFGNSLVKMTLTGAQVHQLLEQQWLGQPFPRILKTSGLVYEWDAAQPVGARIIEVRKDGAPIDKAASYTVTVNSFMAAGGDNFTVLPSGSNQVGGPIDLDALISYIQGLAQPFSAAIEGRIERAN